MDRLKITPVVNPAKAGVAEAFEVLEDYQVRFGDVNVWVPEFFQSDGASTPPLIRQSLRLTNFFNPRIIRAAVVHDWLYHTHHLDRSVADDLFRKILIDDGLSPALADGAFLVLQQFGEPGYANDQETLRYLAALKLRIAESGREPSKYGL